jgi:hypothetical protein
MPGHPLAPHLPKHPPPLPQVPTTASPATRLDLLLPSKKIFKVEAPFRLVRVDHNVSVPVEVVDYDVVREEVWVVLVVIIALNYL